jgi:putative transcriptional regulator
MFLISTKQQKSIDRVSKRNYNEIEFLLDTKKGGEIMRKELKAARLKKNLTQLQVAKYVGIDRSSYSNIERGNKNPSYQVAIKLKKVLGIKDDEIFLETNVSQRNKTFCTISNS